MKLNYTNHEGRRTTITLTQAIVDTWAAAHPHISTQEELTDALKTTIEATKPEKNRTFVATVESDLLADVRERLSCLDREAKRAQAARKALDLDAVF